MLDRRQSMKLIGATAAAMAAPFKSAIAAIRKPSAPLPISLKEQVQALVDKWTPNRINSELDGTYAKVFKLRTATQMIETTTHVVYPGLADIKHGIVSRVDAHETWSESQHFVYNAQSHMQGHTFAAVMYLTTRSVDPGRQAGATPSRVVGRACL